MLQITILQSVALHTSILLTEVAGEGGPHLAPQKFLLSQKFRQLMRCKKYLEKNEYYNLTKFRQNRIKNKKILFLGHFL